MTLTADHTAGLHRRTGLRVVPQGDGSHPQPVKVLYIAGSGRSGSTLLDGILGQVDGVVSTGEMRYVWERGLLHDRLCGCGQPFSKCPVWQAVLADAFGDQPVDAGELIRQQNAHIRFRNFPKAVRAQRRSGAAPGDYPARLADLYRAVQRQTGADVIVDSSKLPPYGYLLQGAPGVELSVVQLVRDPRATAYSWLRSKPLPDATVHRSTMQTQPPAKSAALWAVWNATAERLWTGSQHYLRVRYEDFLADPEGTVRDVLALVGKQDAELPFNPDGTVRMAPTHSVAGNPSRFTRGEVTLRPDAEWRTKMRRRDRALVAAMTLPLLRHYDYPVRTASPAAPASPGGSDRPDGSDQSALFLLGPARSGTSLLYKVLCLHPDVAYLDNYVRRAPAVPRLAVLDRLPRHWPSARRRSWFGGDSNAYVYNSPRSLARRAFPMPVEGEPVFRYCGFAEYPWEQDAPAEVRNRRLRGLVRRVTAASGGRLMVSKRIAHNRRVPQLLEALPQARFVAIVRDGRAVASSLSRVDWWADSVLSFTHGTPTDWAAAGGDPWELCARHWVEDLSEMEDGLAQVPAGQVLRISYEEFCAAPVATVTRIAEFAGLRLDGGWLQELGSMQFPNHNQSWRSLPDDAVATIERVQGDTLTRYGYPRSGSGQA